MINIFISTNDILKAKAKSLKCNAIINYKVETLQIYHKEKQYNVIVSVAGDAVILLDRTDQEEVNHIE